MDVIEIHIAYLAKICWSCCNLLVQLNTREDTGVMYLPTADNTWQRCNVLSQLNMYVSNISTTYLSWCSSDSLQSSHHVEFPSLPQSAAATCLVWQCLLVHVWQLCQAPMSWRIPWCFQVQDPCPTAEQMKSISFVTERDNQWSEFLIL